MSKIFERRQNIIKDACSKYKVDENMVRMMLETQCISRLGISQYDYDKLCRAFNAIPNHIVRMEDKANFYKEMFIKKFCRKMKISKDVLEHKLKTYCFIPDATSDQLHKLRNIFGIKINRHEKYLKERSVEVRRYEKKIIDMFSSGKTYREIAEVMGRPMIDIISKINKLRFYAQDPTFLPLRPPGNFARSKGYSPENIGKLLREGKTVKELSILFDKKEHSLASLIGRWRQAYPHANIPYLRKS